MKNLQRKAILLSLAEKMHDHGSWCSETHIQKCIYFLQKGLNVPLEYDFILYKHGPFSFELRDELSEMRAVDLINLVSQIPYGPSLIPGKRASILKKKFPKTINKYNEATNYIAEHISTDNVSELEKFATALYIFKEETIENSHECATLLNRIKPHIPVEDALAACDKVVEILDMAPSS